MIGRGNHPARLFDNSNGKINKATTLLVWMFGGWGRGAIRESVEVRGCRDKLGKTGAAPKTFAAKRVNACSANHGKINNWRYFSRAGEIGSMIARFSICLVRACQSDASPRVTLDQSQRGLEGGPLAAGEGGGAGALCLSGVRVGGGGWGLHANLRDRGNFPIEMRSRCLSVSVASLRPPFSVSFSSLTRTWSSAYHPSPPTHPGDEGEEHEHHGKGWLSLGWVT